MVQTLEIQALFDLSGKVAIVTGATSGIGRSIALTLAGAGARVVAAGRRVELLEDLAALHPNISAQSCDVTIDDDCRQLVQQTVSTMGSIDVLINNAGITNQKRAQDETSEEFRSVIETNLLAPFVLSREAAAFMFDQPEGGSIVNVASILGMVGLGRIPQAGYTASKGGLVNLTRELAAQWARRGVRVNAIAPGWFHTELTADLFETAKGVDWIARLTPMGRGGKLAELAGAVLYLSGPASSYVTGIVLPVDGGWTSV